MKNVTASEARRDWFRILDEVASGEKVVIQRRGKQIVLTCEDSHQLKSGTNVDYRALIQSRNVDEADRWSWEWSEGRIVSRDKT